MARMMPAILLAGGAASRMGRPKALLPVGPLRESFLERTARVLLEGGADEVIAVLGAGAERIRTAIPPTARLRFVVNPDYSAGQLSSLLTGLRVADRPEVQAVLVTLVDVPLVSPDTVRAVLKAYRTSAGAAKIVRPSRQGQHGHPVIFDRTLFEELRRADLADGSKTVIRGHTADLLDIEVSDEGAFIDIDTPDEYERYIGPFPRV
jgi:molybdenum cofactor cytidylyltransferase